MAKPCLSPKTIFCHERLYFVMKDHILSKDVVLSPGPSEATSRLFPQRGLQDPESGLIYGQVITKYHQIYKFPNVQGLQHTWQNDKKQLSRHYRWPLPGNIPFTSCHTSSFASPCLAYVPCAGRGPSSNGVVIDISGPINSLLNFPLPHFSRLLAMLRSLGASQGPVS